MDCYQEKVYLVSDSNYLFCLDFENYDPMVDIHARGMVSRKFPLCNTYRVTPTEDVADFVILPKKMNSRRDMLDLFRDLYKENTDNDPNQPKLWQDSELQETNDQSELREHQVYFLTRDGTVAGVDATEKSRLSKPGKKMILAERQTVQWLGIIRTLHYTKATGQSEWLSDRVLVVWGYDPISKLSVLLAVSPQSLQVLCRLQTHLQVRDPKERGEPIHNVVDIVREDGHAAYLCLVGMTHSLQLCVFRRKRLYLLYSTCVDHIGSIYFACKVDSWSILFGSYRKRSTYRMYLE